MGHNSNGLNRNLIERRAENTNQNTKINKMTIPMGDLRFCLENREDTNTNMFAALVETIEDIYPSDWKQWAVHDVTLEELFGRKEISPQIAKKINLHLPLKKFVEAIESRIYDEQCKTILTQPSNSILEIKKILLQWPLGRALIYYPRHYMEKIHADDEFQSFMIQSTDSSSDYSDEEASPEASRRGTASDSTETPNGRKGNPTPRRSTNGAETSTTSAGKNCQTQTDLTNVKTTAKPTKKLSLVDARASGSSEIDARAQTSKAKNCEVNKRGFKRVKKCQTPKTWLKEKTLTSSKTCAVSSTMNRVAAMGKVVKPQTVRPEDVIMGKFLNVYAKQPIVRPVDTGKMLEIARFYFQKKYYNADVE